MGKKKAMKRMIAGLTALTLVTAGIPANIGDFLTGGTEVVAFAAASYDVKDLYYSDVTILYQGDIIKHYQQLKNL